MALPPDTISRLDDHFGQYLICVQCPACGNRAEVSPATLAPRYGWRRAFREIVPNFRCSYCRHKPCRVEIAFESKPRGWKSNPS